MGMVQLFWEIITKQVRCLTSTSFVYVQYSETLGLEQVEPELEERKEAETSCLALWKNIPPDQAR